MAAAERTRSANRSPSVLDVPLREFSVDDEGRKAKIEERTREVQRVEKTLQDAGIRLSSVASEVLGVSARRMLDALISGSHDTELLADLAKGSLRKKIPAQREALRGRFTGHHALLIGQCSPRSTSWTRRSPRYCADRRADPPFLP